MVGTFSYSFDREMFRGTFDTRQDALRQGLSQVAEHHAAPDVIYVGKRVPFDPGTSGLAEMLLTAMRRRLREQAGDDAPHAADALLRVNEHQLAELDDAIDRVIKDWLAKHELTPTQSKVIAISEHPVPQPSMNRGNGNGTPSEVRDLGDSESPITLW